MISIHTYLCCIYTLIGDAECRHIPNATNKSVEVLEYSNHTFEFTITGDTTIALQWCFVGSNNHSECCMCNDDPCQNKDWTAVSKCSPSDCHQFTCLLTIHNMTMNYSNGTLISKAAVSDDDVRVVNHTHVSVTQDSNHHHKPLPTLVYDIAIGVGVGVVAIVIVICVVCMTKRNSRCSKSYSVYQDYETIPSSSNNGKMYAHNTTQQLYIYCIRMYIYIYIYIYIYLYL